MLSLLVCQAPMHLPPFVGEPVRRRLWSWKEMRKHR